MLSYGARGELGFLYTQSTQSLVSGHGSVCLGFD